MRKLMNSMRSATSHATWKGTFVGAMQCISKMITLHMCMCACVCVSWWAIEARALIKRYSNTVGVCIYCIGSASVCSWCGQEERRMRKRSNEADMLYMAKHATQQQIITSTAETEAGKAEIVSFSPTCIHIRISIHTHLQCKVKVLERM